jgi:23S rRNA G2069 N7-methylase RlmK/C1962 C5-methylase RlmI
MKATSLRKYGFVVAVLDPPSNVRSQAMHHSGFLSKEPYFQGAFARISEGSRAFAATCVHQRRRYLLNRMSATPTPHTASTVKRLRLEEISDHER